MDKVTRKYHPNWTAAFLLAVLLMALPIACWTAPQFSISPKAAPARWTNADKVTITWQALDASATSEYRVDSSNDLDYSPDVSPLTLYVGATGLNLADGKHTVDVRLTDSEGATTTRSVDCYIDRTNPGAFAPSASPAGWTKGPIQISFATTDLGENANPQTGAGMDYYEVLVGGTSYDIQPSPFGLDVSSFASGTYAVSVEAFDQAGNETTGQTTINVDNTPPAAFDAVPDAADWTKNNVNVSFGTTDPTPGSGVIDHYEVSFDGGPFSPATSPYAVTQEGVHTVAVKAFDGAKPVANPRAANAPVTVKIDKTAPTLSCLCDAYGSTSPISIGYQANDAGSGVKQVALWVKKGAAGTWSDTGQRSTSAAGTFLYNSMTGDDTYYFGFVVTDKAGNASSSASESGAGQIIYDTTVPTFDSIKATPNCAGLGSTVSITFTASEPLGDTPYVSVNDHDADFVGSSGQNYTFSYTIQDSDAEGAADIYVEGIDKAFNYNWTDDTTQLIVDKTPPEDFTPTASPSTWTKADSVELGFIATDKVSWIDHYEVAVDAGDYATQVSPYNLSTGGLSDGAHIVHVKAVDAAGNQRVKDLTVSIDKAAPADFTPTATPSSWTNAPSVAIAFSTTDAQSGIGHYEVALDGGSYATQTSPYALNVSAVADGDHTVHVKAIDAIGNQRTKDVTIHLDKTAPAAFTPVSTPAAWTSATTAQISWSTTDAASGIDHYEVAFGTGAYSTQASPYTLNVSGLAPGSYAVHVKAFDKAGNVTIGDVTAAVAVIGTPPTASLSFSDPNASLGRQFDYILWKNWMGVTSSAQNTYNINWSASAKKATLTNIYVEFRADGTSDWSLLKSSTAGTGTVAFDVSTRSETDNCQFRIRAVDSAGLSSAVVYDKFAIYDATRLAPTTQIIAPLDGSTVAANSTLSLQAQTTMAVFSDPRTPGMAYKSSAPDWWFSGHALNATPKLQNYKKRSDGVPTKLLGTLVSSFPRSAQWSQNPNSGQASGKYLGYILTNTWSGSPATKGVDKNNLLQLEMMYGDLISIGNMRQPDKPNKSGQKLPSSSVEPLVDTLKKCEYSRVYVK